MEQPIVQNQPKVVELVSNLNNSLSSIKPDNSETTKLITYALLATAVVGLMVYHYIREQERSPDAFEKGLENI